MLLHQRPGNSTLTSNVMSFTSVAGAGASSNRQHGAARLLSSRGPLLLGSGFQSCGQEGAETLEVTTRGGDHASG